MPTTQDVKRRFEIIGNNENLNRAINKAVQVAPTDISVLITGESGVGKESIPKIIHQISHRKHNNYIAVNCGAIPEGTIDSELFGHEKGAFTGATSTRKGYFEVADGGTIFLDEVGELPLTTQVRLLRVLETGEFIKVGSSSTQKTNVRIVAATNLNMYEAIKHNKFREDLYYRLNTIEINLPPLRERGDDIFLLFRKFAADFAEKYKMPVIRLDPDSVEILKNYRWPGNIRQLRNFAEQLSVIEQSRLITPEIIRHYLPQNSSSSLTPISKYNEDNNSSFDTDKNILYKAIFDLKNQVNDLKQLSIELVRENQNSDFIKRNSELINRLFGSNNNTETKTQNLLAASEGVQPVYDNNESNETENNEDYYNSEQVIDIEETDNLSLIDKEKEMIKMALEKNGGKRKNAAAELGISERTLYRKIKQYFL